MDEEIKMALKHLNTLSKEEELYQEALTAQINKVAYDLDRAGLLKEGRQEGLQEVALNLLKKNAELSFISEVTGLSEDQIIKLKSN